MRRLYRTLASNACSSVSAYDAMISGVASGILIASICGFAKMFARVARRNLYTALPASSIIHSVSGPAVSTISFGSLTLKKSVGQVSEVFRQNNAALIGYLNKLVAGEFKLGIALLVVAIKNFFDYDGVAIGLPNLGLTLFFSHSHRPHAGYAEERCSMERHSARRRSTC